MISCFNCRQPVEDPESEVYKEPLCDSCSYCLAAAGLPVRKR